MAQNLQGFSYKVCSTMAYYTIIHQQLVAMLRGFMRFVYTICQAKVITGTINKSGKFKGFFWELPLFSPKFLAPRSIKQVTFD